MKFAGYPVIVLDWIFGKGQMLDILSNSDRKLYKNSSVVFRHVGYPAMKFAGYLVFVLDWIFGKGWIF